MTVPTLSYDSPTRPTPSVWLHYVALTCGLIPLGAGTIIFLAFLAFRHLDIAFLGLVTILVGTCLAFVGVTCAGVYLFQAKRADPDVGTVARRRAKIDLAVIIANFPIAFGMAWAGIWLLSRITIAVHNADAVPLERFRIVLPHGVGHDLGTIPPNGSRSVTVSDADYDGEFTAVFTVGGEPREQAVTDAWEDDDDNTVRVSIQSGKIVPSELADHSEP